MKKSKLDKECEKYAGLLEKGKVLAIDPSSGSAKSAPGFAFIEQGILLESGTYFMPKGDITGRLYALAEALRKDFSDIDVLIIESLPPYMQSAGSSFKSRSVMNLHMSVGAIYGALGHAITIGVTPSSWHAEARRLNFTYEKSDENDALILAHTVFKRADVKLVGVENKLRRHSEEAKHLEILSGDTQTDSGRSPQAD